VVEINENAPTELIEAVRCWTGWGDSAMPSRNDERLLERFGCEKGAVLLSEIKGLKDDFYLSDARLVAADIQDMARRCADDFRRKRPGIAEEIVNAFVWCYTFDYK
jgi:hypothetical protein